MPALLTQCKTVSASRFLEDMLLGVVSRCSVPYRIESHRIASHRVASDAIARRAKGRAGQGRLRSPAGRRSRIHQHQHQQPLHWRGCRPDATPCSFVQRTIGRTLVINTPMRATLQAGSAWNTPTTTVLPTLSYHLRRPQGQGVRDRATEDGAGCTTCIPLPRFVIQSTALRIRSGPNACKDVAGTVHGGGDLGGPARPVATLDASFLHVNENRQQTDRSCHALLPVQRLLAELVRDPAHCDGTGCHSVPERVYQVQCVRTASPPPISSDTQSAPSRMISSRRQSAGTTDRLVTGVYAGAYRSVGLQPTQVRHAPCLCYQTACGFVLTERMSLYRPFGTLRITAAAPLPALRQRDMLRTASTVPN